MVLTSAATPTAASCRATSFTIATSSVYHPCGPSSRTERPAGWPGERRRRSDRRRPLGDATNALESVGDDLEPHRREEAPPAAEAIVPRQDDLTSRRARTDEVGAGSDGGDRPVADRGARKDETVVE